ncbi:fatty acid phospholipid synthesis protein plsx [Ligilactobacillus hayakitensis DSM 18933 = JCM 14209]|uniref:Phosphate acyltransferase n=1 Tax=Ligilactobacillus hayakitensis DSM 18933 = JCM 14209 TaxID=1423755 RepID=A0A0R1WUU5_9LACO|nr:phosphate acyltransferase PlsX [Ligilactobacillus hayakitensis]KRM18870.1 fatty acid phospholipid synthesis protein plsx [Ligilactobacillus hayakitensis DSM 18933 = JCM 14209]
MRIAVDAMGGDFAPKSVVEGVKRASKEFKDIEFQLYGDKNQIEELISESNNVKIFHTTELIDMNDEPVKAIRRKKDSSLVRAAQAVKDGEADALFSCGNTGALLASGLLIVGRIKGVARPGLLSTLPVLSDNGGAFNLLDSGANADNKADQLYQYALLGKYYAQSVRGIENPRIGLLNNGTEPHKGSKLTLEAHQLIAADESINFVGNVESKDLLNGVCDVVVADGFTGNAVLKAIEGTAKTAMGLLKSTVKNSGIRGILGGLLLKPSLKKMASKMSAAQYGGAVLLGTKSPVVKAHGASDSETIYYTIKQIHEMLETDMIGKFTKSIQSESKSNKE